MEELTLQSRLGVLLQLFRGPEQIHLLLLSQPADGVPDLCNRALDFAHPAVSVDCTRVDEDALIGRYSSTGEIFPGLLRETGSGIIRFKQLGSLDGASRLLAEPLEEGRMTVAAGNYTETFETPVSALTSARTEYEYCSM
jgi:hypothetical protein